MNHLSKLISVLALLLALSFSSCSHKMAINSSKRMETQTSLSVQTKRNAVLASKSESGNNTNAQVQKIGNTPNNIITSPNVEHTEAPSMTSSKVQKSHLSRRSRIKEVLNIAMPVLKGSNAVKSIKEASLTKSIDPNLKIALILLILSFIFALIPTELTHIIGGILFIGALIFALIWVLSL